MFQDYKILLWSLSALVALVLSCKTAEPAKTIAADQNGTATTQVVPPPTLTTDSTQFEFDTLAQAALDTPVWISKKGAYNPENTKKFKLLHTKLEVRFDWQKQQLKGLASLSLQPYFYNQNEVVLDAKGFDIYSIEMVENNGKILKQKMRYSYQDSLKLTIFLDKTFTRNDKFTIQIDYLAKPNQLPAKGSNAITSDKGLYFINPLGTEKSKPRQVWTQGETEANSCWFPTFDAPNVKTTQEMWITVEKSFITLSNGKMISQKLNPDGTRTDIWKMEKPHAPYLFMMAVGNFAVVKDKWRDKEVNYYVEPQYAKYAKNIFGNTPEMMEHFSKLLDYPFPWEKYAQVVVRDYVSGAMENTTASIFMEQLQVDNRALLDENWDGIIAHELFHQWFGNLVTCESWANLPLNESFANYSEYLWKEHKYGKDEADAQLREEFQEYLAEADTKREPMIRYNYLDKEEMFDRHSYSKGCLIVNMLREQVGDDAFFEALRRYLKKFQYKNAEINDLRLVFEEVTGEDLNWFFNQWFLEAGHPELTVTDTFLNNKVVLRVKQEQDERFTPIYKLPLYIDIWAGGKKIRKHITITKKEEEFTFDVPQKPDLVFFDGQTQLLGLVYHEKNVEEYIFQYKNSEQFLAKQDAIGFLRSFIDNPEARAVLLSALDDKAYLIRQDAAFAFEQFASPEKDRETIIKKLRDMALNDKKALVRSTATGVLASINPIEFADIFEKGMNDSSYTVLANSLYGYAMAEKEDATERFAQYESIDNLSVIVMMASYYAYRQIDGKYDWFVSKMDKKYGQELNYLINYFATYLANNADDANLKAKGADYLVKIATQNPNYNSRIAAYQAVSVLEGVIGLEQKLAEVRRKETDKRVLDFYKANR